jgi:hypothetical protein
MAWVSKPTYHPAMLSTDILVMALAVLGALAVVFAARVS